MSLSVYGNGDTNYYTYDSVGRLSALKQNDVNAYNWTYSGSGIAKTYTDNISGRKYQYTYDSFGRPISQTGKNITGGGNRTSSVYSYDISNNLTKISNSAGTQNITATFSYDNVNRPIRSYFNGASYHTYSYDLLGRLDNTSIKLTDVIINKNYTYYNSANRTASGYYYRTTQLQTETIGDRGYTYTYDNVGNITAITEKTTANGSYNEKVSYTYDSLGQLTRENNKDLNKTIVYTYDNGGNIKTVKEYAYTTGTLGTVTDTINYTYDSTWKDKLVSYDGDTITYDAIGNPLSYRDGMAFTWYGRRMKTANVGGTAISYKYNADGLRTEKKVGSTVHTYEYTGNTLFYENRGGMELHYRYDVNGNLASITRVNTDGVKFTLYAICNSRGDVEELRQLNGSLYARYVYDTWGNTLHIYDANGAEITNTNNLAMQNPIRYRGYYYDSETGLYYLQSRYYDPVTCRFLSPDAYVSTGQGVLGYNMFAYCNNNAVINIDITGTIHVKGIDACGIVSEDSFSVGKAIYYSQTDDFWSFDNIFFGIDTGESYTLTSNGNHNDDLVFFYQDAHTDGSFFDNKIGFNLNIKNGGFRFAKGVKSYSIVICFDNTSYEIFSSPTKTGLTISSGVNYKNLTADEYITYYFRPAPIICAVAIMCYSPNIAYFVASYFLYNGTNHAFA